MTLLAVPIFGDSIDDVRRDIDRAIDLGADLIELRLDLMEGVSDDALRSLCEAISDEAPSTTGRARLILTIRSAEEGGAWRGSEEDRLERLIALGPFVDFVDVELATWERSEEVRSRIQLALGRAGHISQEDGRETIEYAARRELILSRHDLSGRPHKLQGDLLRMLETQACRVPKLAWQARTVRDNFEAFEWMRHGREQAAGGACKPPIVICMGPDGLPSRVLAKKFGAFATFAAVGAGRASAPGQITIDELKERYRWDCIDEQTAVYGVIGDPIEHSISPHVHNAAFAQSDCNAVYLPFRVAAGYESFKAFMVDVLARPWMGVRGFSVTLPHKENALRFLESSGAGVDEVSRCVGAVNTISIGPDGSLAGLNTDQDAAIEVIASGMGRSADDLAGLSAMILGAGGVARAVVAGLTSRGADVTIHNRSEEKSQALAERFGCTWAPWDRRGAQAADLIVNCTSLGLWPGTEASPLDAAILERHRPTVFDTVYNPLQTKLLREAEGLGCNTIDGLAMFVLQAHAQFEFWALGPPSLDFFRDVALKALPAR